MNELLQSIPKNKFFLIAGPCVVENRELVLQVARHISAITTKLGIPFIFKASYRKANRSRIDSFTGIGDIEALEYIKEVSETFGVPSVTDIHSESEAAIAARYCDVLQIPA